jgi:hypothetical protein
MQHSCIDIWQGGQGPNVGPKENEDLSRMPNVVQRAKTMIMRNLSPDYNHEDDA